MMVLEQRQQLAAAMQKLGAVDLAERVESVAKVLSAEADLCKGGFQQDPSFHAFWLSEQAMYLQVISDRLRELSDE